MLMERRNFPRSAYMADVPAHADGRPVTLFVYDLSMDGCMIQSATLEVREGQAIVLEFDEQCTAAGTVQWCKNLSAGMRFSSPLKPDTIARLVATVANGPYVEDAFPKLDRRVLKAGERKIDPPRY
jgi:hypothetical protein